MKMKNGIAKLLCSTFLLASAAGLVSASPRLVLQPESSVWLVGDSTLHPFTSLTKDLKVTSELDLKAAPNDALKAVLQKGALKQLTVVVPVKSLKSDEKGLDKNLYKALKADEFSEILFQLSSYEASPNTVKPLETHIRATGTLRIAGQDQAVTLEGDAMEEKGILRVQGKYTLLMTDYGVKPPTMMMGTIKVRNPVVIHYDLTLRPVDEK